MSLLLGADEKDMATIGGYLLDKLAGFVQQAGSLLKVNDMNAITLGKEVFLHTWVPATRLVPKLSSSF